MHGPSQDRVSFDPGTAGVLAAFADTLIPPEGAFPAPSAIRVVEDFMTRYVVADDAEVVYLPAVTEADVAALVGRLETGFAEAGQEERSAALTAMEAEEAELFGRLRLLVYAGYYSRPEVRAAIANTLAAGRDFRGTPQPYGYADAIEDWDESLLNRSGSYVRTEEVEPVDPDKLAALVASFAASDDESGATA